MLGRHLFSIGDSEDISRTTIIVVRISENSISKLNVRVLGLSGKARYGLVPSETLT